MLNRAISRTLRVLVVEDEAVIALHVQELLSSAGHIVIGPFSDPQPALETMRATSVDLAILDVMVHGKAGFSVPDELSRQGIPFLFITGASQNFIPAEYRDRPSLNKPFATAELTRMIAAVSQVKHTLG